MSRSYKKYPKLKQEKPDKKQLSRRLRRKSIDYPASGGLFKHIVKNRDTWQYRWTLEDAVKQYEIDENIQNMYPTLESWVKYWKNCCLRK